MDGIKAVVIKAALPILFGLIAYISTFYVSMIEVKQKVMGHEITIGRIHQSLHNLEEGQHEIRAILIDSTRYRMKKNGR